MTTKACILERSNNSSGIYEYVMLAIAYERSKLSDLYTLKFSAWENLNLADDEADILAAYFNPADYHNAQDFYHAMSKLPA